MTKPAAVFMQILGVVVALGGIGAESWTIGLIGAALFIWGGVAIRKRLKG